MILGWLKATERNSTSVRVLLFDYRKAFDLIDYKVLVNKLKQVNTPNIIGLLTFFQEDLKGSNSERTSFYSGAGCRLVGQRGRRWDRGFFYWWLMTCMLQLSKAAYVSRRWLSAQRQDVASIAPYQLAHGGICTGFFYIQIQTCVMPDYVIYWRIWSRLKQVMSTVEGCCSMVIKPNMRCFLGYTKCPKLHDVNLGEKDPEEERLMWEV